MKDSTSGWIHAGKAVVQSAFVAAAYLGIIALVIYPVFDASRTLT